MSVSFGLIANLILLGIEVNKELGTYLCLTKNFDEGLEKLYIALELQKKTIEGSNIIFLPFKLTLIH